MSASRQGRVSTLATLSKMARRRLRRRIASAGNGAAYDRELHPAAYQNQRGRR